MVRVGVRNRRDTPIYRGDGGSGGVPTRKINAAYDRWRGERKRIGRRTSRTIPDDPAKKRAVCRTVNLKHRGLRRNSGEQACDESSCSEKTSNGFNHHDPLMIPIADTSIPRLAVNPVYSGNT